MQRNNVCHKNKECFAEKKDCGSALVAQFGAFLEPYGLRGRNDRGGLQRDLVQRNIGQGARHLRWNAGPGRDVSDHTRARGWVRVKRDGQVDRNEDLGSAQDTVERHRLGRALRVGIGRAVLRPH